MAFAVRSFPVPLSPRISTGFSVGATFLIKENTSSIALELPIKYSSIDMPFVASKSLSMTCNTLCRFSGLSLSERLEILSKNVSRI